MIRYDTSGSFSPAPRQAPRLYIPASRPESSMEWSPPPITPPLKSALKKPGIMRRTTFTTPNGQDRPRSGSMSNDRHEPPTMNMPRPIRPGPSVSTLETAHHRTTRARAQSMSEAEKAAVVKISTCTISANQMFLFTYLRTDQNSPGRLTLAASSLSI